MTLPITNVGDTAIGIVTLDILVSWLHLGIRLPDHLPALLVSCAVMGVASPLGGHTAAIGPQSHYVLADDFQGNNTP